MKILLLGAHPDARVRVRIAYRLGMLKRVDFIAELVAATGDPDGEVSAEAFRALSILDAKLSDEDRERLDEAAFELLDSEHAGVREEATIRVEKEVDKVLQQAQELVAKAQIEDAVKAMQLLLGV